MKSRNGLDPKYAARNSAKGIVTPKKIGSGGELASQRMPLERQGKKRDRARVLAPQKRLISCWNVRY